VPRRGRFVWPTPALQISSQKSIQGHGSYVTEKSVLCLRVQHLSTAPRQNEIGHSVPITNTLGIRKSLMRQPGPAQGWALEGCHSDTDSPTRRSTGPNSLESAFEEINPGKSPSRHLNRKHPVRRYYPLGSRPIKHYFSLPPQPLAPSACSPPRSTPYSDLGSAMSQHQPHSTEKRAAHSSRIRDGASQIFMRHLSQIKLLTPKRINELKRSFSRTQESFDAPSNLALSPAGTLRPHMRAPQLRELGKRQRLSLAEQQPQQLPPRPREISDCDPPVDLLSNRAPERHLWIDG
jgi:hypothetical protein